MLMALVGLLIAEREANGPFVDFYYFCERVDFQVLNKKTLEVKLSRTCEKITLIMLPRADRATKARRILNSPRP